MKAVFTVGSDNDHINQQSHFEIAILFNGMPEKVVLEVTRIHQQGFSGESDNPITREQKNTELVMRTVLEASHARAISSALLSAATEARK